MKYSFVHYQDSYWDLRNYHTLPDHINYLLDHSVSVSTGSIQVFIRTSLPVKKYYKESWSSGSDKCSLIEAKWKPILVLVLILFSLFQTIDESRLF